MLWGGGDFLWNADGTFLLTVLTIYDCVKYLVAMETAVLREFPQEMKRQKDHDLRTS